MWVEVIGLPAVGKTTIIEENLSFIKENYKIIESRKSFLFQKIIAKFLYFFVYKNKVQDKKFVQKISYRHSFRFLENRKENLFFYDSGILQLFLENQIENNFENSRDLPLHLCPDHVIYLKEDIGAVVDREMARQPRRFDFSAEEVQKRYEKAQNWLENELLPNIAIVDIITSENISEFTEVIKREKTS